MKKTGSGLILMALALGCSEARAQTTSEVVTVQSDLTRREIPQIVWFVPWSEKLDVSVFVGPSFVHVQQDVITASVSSTQVVAVGTANETGMAFGGSVGIDATSFEVSFLLDALA